MRCFCVEHKLMEPPFELLYIVARFRSEHELIAVQSRMNRIALPRTRTVVRDITRKKKCSLEALVTVLRTLVFRLFVVGRNRRGVPAETSTMEFDVDI